MVDLSGCLQPRSVALKIIPDGGVTRAKKF